MSQVPISPFLRAWYKWKMLRLPWRRQFLIGLDLKGNTYWEFLDPGSRLPSPDPVHHPLTSPVRWRRIVRYPSGTHHSSVVVPPAWHQWLRHTRPDPPSLAEQQAEVARQERIKLLAAQANARWEAKPKVMEDVGGKKKDVLGVRSPAFETERPRGPGSKVTGAGGGKAQTEVWGTGMGTSTGTDTAADKSTAAADVDRAGGTDALGPAPPTPQPPPQPHVTDEGALRDIGAVNQRDEAWKRNGDAGSAKEEKKEAHDPWKQNRSAPGDSWQPKAWEPAAKGKQ